MRFFNIFNLVLTVLILFGVIGVVKNLINMNKTSDRLSRAEEQVFKLEDKRGELLVDREKKKSIFYLEQEIRNKLRMVKPGEKLVVLPKELMEKNEDEIYKYGLEDEVEDKEALIFEKWIAIFF